MKKLLIYCMLLLPMASGVSAQRVADSVTVMGMVVDKDTQEQMPFIIMKIVKGKSVVAKAITDFDGMYEMKVPDGNYLLTASAVGYYDQAIRFVANKDVVLQVVKMKPFLCLWDKEFTGNPIIEYGPDGANQNMEIDGVNVKVR